MFRNPVIPTLEEDLKKIGLLKEEGPEKKAPSGDPASNKASSARNVGAMSDDPSNEGGDEHDEPEGIPHGGKVPKTIPAAKDPQPEKAGSKQESIKGMPDKRRAVECDGDDDDDDMDDQDDEKPKKSKKDDEKDESVAVTATNRAVEAVAKARARVEGRSFDHVSKLLEDVNSIMESIDKSRRNESVKAFANLSIISEMLHRGIGAYAERTEDAELSEAAEAFTLMAQESAEIAKAIEEGEDLDEEALAGEFRNQVDALLQGLDLYSDMMEALQSEAEEIAEEEDLEEGEDDGDDNDDDGEDDADAKDDKDEAVRLEPGLGTSRNDAAALAKKGKQMGSKGLPKNITIRDKANKQSVHRVEGAKKGKAESYLPYGKGKAQK